MDIQAALEQLRSGEESVRRHVVDELGRSGRPEAITPLLLAVADESWPVRQAAAERLAAFDDGARSCPRLEAALRDDENAAHAQRGHGDLRQAGRPVPCPVCCACSGDGDEEVRNFAAVMLGQRRESSAVPALIAALGDPDVNVRHAAAASLGQIGAPEAVVPLIQVLRGEPWLQYPAIHALAEIGDARATPALVELLEDEMLRGPVMDALGRVAGREALQAPRPAPLRSGPRAAQRGHPRRGVDRAARDGGRREPRSGGAGRAAAGGPRRPPPGHARGRRAAEPAHRGHHPRLAQGAARGSDAHRAAWASPPSRSTSPTPSSPSASQPRGLPHGLEHPDDAVRQGTIRCLAWIAPPGGIDLVAPLIHDPSPEVRAEAAAAIGRLGHEDAAMLLFELLGDESELIQESAMSALAHMPAERVVPLLLQALGQRRCRSACGPPRRSASSAIPRRPPRSSPSRRTRGRRCAAPPSRRWARSTPPGVPDLLRAALLDESSLVRQQAVLSPWASCRTSRPRRDLVPLLDDPDPKMRFVTLRALGQIRNRDVVVRVIPFLADERKELRFAAVEALGSIRAMEAVRALVDDPRRPRPQPAPRGRREPGQHRRPAGRAAAPPGPRGRALERPLRGRHRPRPDPAAPRPPPPLLARLADEDATVRRAAVAALGEIGDTRAAAAG